MKKMYKNIKEDKKYPTTMRFSNQQKIGIKWARKYHKELRKGYLLDNENQKYNIPKGYYKEMLRYQNSLENETMTQTAIEIEQKQIELINKLKEKGLLTREEIKKKAEKLRNKYKKIDRDTF